MTGSGKNASAANILTGQPLSLLYTGDVVLADSSHIAFAVATLGGAGGSIVSWQTDEFITRLNWLPIAGTKYLVPNQRYFLSGKGTIALTGTQQVGVAKSKTDLRVDVQSATVSTSVTQTVIPVVPVTPSPAGFVGSIFFEIVAAMLIPSFSPVTITGLVADSSNTAHFAKAIGISTASIASGFAGNVQTEGRMDNPAWTWTAGSPVYLNGTALSMTSAPTGFSQQFGIAQSPTSLYVHLEEPVLL